MVDYITGRIYSFNMAAVDRVSPELTSNDATLSGLTVVDGSSNPVSYTPSPFDSEHTVYTANVEPEVESVTVTATPNHGSATAVVSLGTDDDGTFDLEDGTNTIVIEVTAQDGTTKDYTLGIDKRPVSTDATLQTLELTDLINSPPDNQVTLTSVSTSATKDEYTATVANAVDQVTVTAIPTYSDYVESVVINGTDVTNDHELVVALVAQEVGNPVVNTITVVVTAEDGVTTKTYEVDVSRQRALSDVATLNDLVLTYGEEEADLTPAFASDGYSYTTSVAHGVTSVVVKFEKGDQFQTVALRAGGAVDINGDVTNEAP